MSTGKVVLITGASSGIGQSTARWLSQRNYRVFGTSRIDTNCGDVGSGCRADSVAACMKTVLSRVGRLDVLVNNADHELAGALEEISLNEAQSQFESNCFGVVRMVMTVLRGRSLKRSH